MFTLEDLGKWFIIALIYGPFLAPVVGWLWCIAEVLRHNKQTRRQQAIQTHSIEIEAQDGGGYSVIE